MSQANESVLVMLADYAIADLQTGLTPPAMRGLVGVCALRCLFLLTRDAHWVSSYGAEGGILSGSARGGGGVWGHDGGLDVLFERITLPLTEVLIGFYQVSSTTTGGLVVQGSREDTATFVGKEAVRLALAVVVQVSAPACDAAHHARCHSSSACLQYPRQFSCHEGRM